MQEERSYVTYIMASQSGTLYIGMTNGIVRRAFEHKHGVGGVFTRKYRCTKLVYWEEFYEVLDAIGREKELKGWLRSKKVALIRSRNSTWFDLAYFWEDPFKDLSEEELRTMYGRCKE